MTISRASSSSRASVWSHPRTPWIVLGIILALALIPRACGLSQAWIWIDEDLTWLATDGVLETGLPELPSGITYPRAPLYTYVASGARWVGERIGRHEDWNREIEALRAPSLLFSLGLIVVVFLFGRSVGGTAAGLLAALVIAGSPWDVHYARMARMYELFALLFTLTVYLAYLGLVRGRPKARVWMLITAILAVASHQQAATTAAVFAVPLMFPREKRPPLSWLLAGIVVAAIAYKVVSGLSFTTDQIIDVGPEGEAPSFSLLGIGIALNHARALLVESFRANAIVGGAAIAAVAALGLWNTWRVHRSGSLLAAVFALLAAAALLVNQLVLAGCLTLVGIKLSETTVSGGIRRGLDMLGIALAAAVITLGAFALTHGIDATGDRMVLRSFVAMPVAWYKKLWMTYPAMSAVVIAAIAVHVLRSLRRGADQTMFFLCAAFLVPLIGQGIVASPYFGFRYNFYLSPLMVLIFILSTLPIVRLLTDAITPRARRLAVATTMIGVILVIPCDAFRPVEACRVHLRGPGYNRDLFRHPDLNASYNYDFVKTSTYVLDHREPGDLVISRDPVNLYPYHLASDYVVSGEYDGLAQSAAGEPIDLYLGIPYIGDADRLADVLNAHSGVNRWIVYTMPAGPDGPHTNLPHTLLDYLAALRHAYPPPAAACGTDSTTIALEIPRGDEVPRPEEASSVPLPTESAALQP